MGVAERRAREREARKSSVLDAARSLLLERGFNGTTSKLIAERCELSEATLFFYFKNKDEIIVSLHSEGAGFWGEGLTRLLDLELAPEKKFARLWQFFKKVKDEHPEYYVVYAYLARPNALADISDELKQQIIQSSGENFRRLSKLLEDITGRSDGRLMADMVWSTFLGLMVLRESRGNLRAKIHPTDHDLTAVCDMLTKALLT